ncbi:MAG: FecR domain-containing protein [Pseudomonadota bacterium]|nr:FecR domain-containing protein [Pseudomonadota bacterium]
MARARSLENAFPEAHRREPRRGIIAAGGLALAAFALVLIAAPNLLLHNPPLQTVMLSAGPVDRHYRLSDGSSLTLAAASVIKVSISLAERRAELEMGRARIIVARDPRTFHIVAGSVDRGVNHGTFLASVTGAAGVVATERGNPATSSVSPVGSSVAVGPTVVRGLLPSQGPIEFAGMRLDEVVADVNADAGAKLLLLDPSLGSLRITGIYRRGDVVGLARVLATTFDLDLEDSGGGMISLRRRRK